MMFDVLIADWLATLYPYASIAATTLITILGASLLSRLVCIPLQEKAGRVRPKWKARLAFLLPTTIWLFAIIFWVSSFEMGLDSLTEFLFAGGLIIGLVITPAGSNAIAGLFNAWGDIFRIGEIIEIHGAVGRVIQRGILSTRMETPEGTFYDVPNKLLLDNMVCNFTRISGFRIEVLIPIDDFDFDLRKTKHVLESVIANKKWNLHGHKALVMFDEIAPNSYNFRVYAWVPSRSDVVPMKGVLLEECYLTLDDAGISAGQTSFVATKRFAIADSWDTAPVQRQEKWTNRPLAAS
jgi:small-conductance mechanosensitive channel